MGASTPAFVLRALRRFGLWLGWRRRQAAWAGWLGVGWLAGYGTAIVFRPSADSTPAAMAMTAPASPRAVDAATPKPKPPPPDMARLRQKIQALPAAAVPADAMALTLSANLPARTWKYIVVHHTATAGGGPEGIDRHHRVEMKMPNGLAYHFLIGNGQGFGDGEIYASRRWREQLNGGHVRGLELNEVSLGIALVGNFEETAPTDRQIAALKGLLAILGARTGLGPADLHGHGAMNGQKTACPGRYFPVDAFAAAIPDPPADGSAAAAFAVAARQGEF